MPITPPPATPQTAEQPAFHPDNVTAHPGSTAAGVGLWFAALAQSAVNGLPTSGDGWFMFIAQAVGGLLAVLGK